MCVNLQLHTTYSAVSLVFRYVRAGFSRLQVVVMDDEWMKVLRRQQGGLGPIKRHIVGSDSCTDLLTIHANIKNKSRILPVKNLVT